MVFDVMNKYGNFTLKNTFSYLFFSFIYPLKIIHLEAILPQSKVPKNLINMYSKYSFSSFQYICLTIVKYHFFHTF